MNCPQCKGYRLEPKQLENQLRETLDDFQHKFEALWALFR